MNSLKEYGALGRRDGERQKCKCSSKDDERVVYPERLTEQERYAYLAGFYRGYGYRGTSNRRQRKFATAKKLSQGVADSYWWGAT